MSATFTCPRCERTSHNENDSAHLYCSACDVFFEPHEVFGRFARDVSDARADEELDAQRERRAGGRA